MDSFRPLRAVLVCIKGIGPVRWQVWRHSSRDVKQAITEADENAGS